MGPMGSSSTESWELLRNVALALQGLGFQVRALGPNDGPLQELRKVGLEAAWECMGIRYVLSFFGGDVGGRSPEDHGSFMGFGDLWGPGATLPRSPEPGYGKGAERRQPAEPDFTEVRG